MTRPALNEPIPITRGMLDQVRKICPEEYPETMEMIEAGKVKIVPSVTEVQDWVRRNHEAQSCKA